MFKGSISDAVKALAWFIMWFKDYVFIFMKIILYWLSMAIKQINLKIS
jgi:hypothetical protein